jgi:mono/diheme cytochrome c family protein
MRKVAAIGVVTIGIAMLAPALVHAQGNAAKGKALFDQNCVTCHGPKGKGDGPAAAALKPKPQNLSDKATMGKLKNQDIAKVIKNGGAAAGKSPLMPPFGGSLKDSDIQDVVAYIRTLAK